MVDDLDHAQERLGRTLERARASEDRELGGRVRDEGAQLVHQLNGLLRMSRLHSLDNRAFEKPLHDTALSLESLIGLLGTLTVALVEDQVYLNEIRIRLDDQQGGVAELAAELARHGLGGLRFHGAPREPELRRFVACFAEKPDAQTPSTALRAALQRDGLESIEPLGRFRVRLAGEPGKAGAPDAEDALKRCAQAVSDAFDNLGRGRLFNPLPARRAIAQLLAAAPGPEALAVDLPSCAAHVAHALRVCRLALLLGRELGLSHAVLQDLGVAALLHDVGYAEPARPGPLPPAGFFRHAAAGARLLLRQRGFHTSKVRRVRAVLGHHDPAEGRRPPALAARVIRIAEDYDTLVGRAGIHPPQALGSMMAAGTLYDPLLMQAFVNVLGACPPGTRVTLTDGSSGTVIAPGRGVAGFARPLVGLDRTSDGSTPTVPLRVDLAQSSLSLSGVRDSSPTPEASGLVPFPATEFILLKPSTPDPAKDPASSGRTHESEGTVTQGVPIRLIHDAHLERRRGHLIFESEEERCTLHFVQGDVVAVSSSRPEHGLPALLECSSLVEAAALREALRTAARSGRPLGRTLLDAGLLDAELLEQALAAQARMLVSSLVEWEGGRYRFVADAGPQPEEDEGHSISTDGLIMGAVRALHDPDVVRFALGDLDRVPLRSPDPARRGALDLLGPAETALLRPVDGHATARDILKAVGLPAAEAERALLTLLALGLVEFSPA